MNLEISSCIHSVMKYPHDDALVSVYFVEKQMTIDVQFTVGLIEVWIGFAYIWVGENKPHAMK